jgi:adenylate cyclase class IV
MLAELELKAVVPDPEALRARLRHAGAIPGFRGRMTDRRYDRAGDLAARDELLRIRTYHHPNGSTESVLAWKGATGRSPEGYKLRQEIELAVRSERGAAERLLGALGYAPVHLIERAIVVIGIPRGDFTPEALSEFVRRYEARTGTPARLSAEGAA